MRPAPLLAIALLGCHHASPAKSPPAMHPMGVMSEADFKALHELRTDAPPVLYGEELTVGGARAYLSMPEGATAPVPGIVLIHEWWGLNVNIEHWADRLAALGFATLAIDLYDGKVASTPDEAMAAMNEVDEAKADAVISAAIDYLAEAPEIQAPRRAVMGWCFGGGWSLEAALDHPELDAAIMYYGMPETDVARLKTLHPALLGVFANQDGHITPEVVDQFEAALSEAGAHAELHRYDADHAFANPSNPSYDEANAAAAWDEVVSFLESDDAPMKRVALVTSEALPNLWEDDLPLIPALAELGVDATPTVWSDPAVDWRAFDALVIRSPWDYFIRLQEFRAWLDARIASGVLMCNAAEILDWNFDKQYLQDLAAAGASLVPTIVVERGESPDVAALARARGWDDIVVKPTISGGAYRLHRFRLADYPEHRDEIAVTLRDRGVLIQPFLPEIETDGELSLLFFDGVFSHAVRKRPKPGDYRVQFQYGGTSEAVEVSEAWIAGARACIAAAPSLPVYARVDGVIHDGVFLLMELEVFEPLMFLARHPPAAAAFARAIAGRLG